MGFCIDRSAKYVAGRVAGVAALILSVNPNLTAAQVRTIIEQTAQKVGGYNYATTSGRPNGTAFSTTKTVNVTPVSITLPTPWFSVTMHDANGTKGKVTLTVETPISEAVYEWQMHINGQEVIYYRGPQTSITRDYDTTLGQILFRVRAIKEATKEYSHWSNSKGIHIDFYPSSAGAPQEESEK